MINAVYMPRINANEDDHAVVHIYVAEGQKVHAGDLLFEVESSKSVMEVVSEYEGYVLALEIKAEDVVRVGTAALWIGDSMAEKDAIKRGTEAPAGPASSAGPTLKALQLIKAHHLDAAKIPAKGGRLSAEDVEAYLASVHSDAPGGAGSVTDRRGKAPSGPVLAGRRTSLTTYQKAMIDTVSWQYDQACATYLEIIYDHAVWRRHADAFAKEHRMILDPMLSLMAYSLVRAAVENPLLNSTVANGELVTSDTVNLGFTVEVDERLFLLVVENAGQYDRLGFAKKLGELQKKAFKGALHQSELSGATIGFTSLAKRGVSRHIPILPPNAAMMVSHSAPLPVSGAAASFVPCVLGATYDHRVLDGSAVAQALAKAATPKN